MTAKLDIKSGSRITYDKNGYRVERYASVSNVVGNIDELLLNAINDGDLPNYGDSHSVIPDITLNSLVASPLGGGNYRITMSYYKDPGSAIGSSNATVSASATTTPEQTESDINGNRLEARFLASYYNGSYSFSRYWTAEVERPRITYEFTYTTNTFPKTQIDTYLNKVNLGVWNGYAEKTILCTAVNVNEEGGSFRVVFSFAYNENTWQFIASIKERDMRLPLLPHGTDPDAGVDLINGTKSFDVYEAVSFTPLGFTL